MKDNNILTTKTQQVLNKGKYYLFTYLWICLFFSLGIDNYNFQICEEICFSFLYLLSVRVHLTVNLAVIYLGPGRTLVEAEQSILGQRRTEEQGVGAEKVPPLVSLVEWSSHRLEKLHISEMSTIHM